MGLPPGSVVFVGENKIEHTKISVIDYDENNFSEREIGSVEECGPLKASPSVSWINIDGIHQPEIVQKLGTLFDLHPLTMEDIVNTDQRPKREDMGHYIYVVLNMIYFDKTRKLVTEQVSLILGKNFLLSFQEQEREGDVFNYVRNRIRGGKGKHKKLGPDYLLYSLLDAIIDYYFIILEDIGEQIERLETDLINDPGPTILHQLYDLKRVMLSLRRSIWPLREVISGLERDETPLLDKATLLYLQDLYGHAVQIIDTIEILRETLSSMLEIYLSSVSNRLNTVMKFLTLVATIFMPLTFIAGVYGMNFKYMPELEWRYGYPVCLAIMLICGVGMMIYFKAKKWI